MSLTRGSKTKTYQELRKELLKDWRVRAWYYLIRLKRWLSNAKAKKTPPRKE